MKKVVVIAEDAKSLILTRKELLLEMIDSGASVDVLVPEDRNCAQLKGFGCKIIPVKINRRGTNPFSDGALLVRYITLLTKKKYDLAICYSIKPNIYGGIACRMKGIPYYLNITGMGSALNNAGVIKSIVTVLYRASAPAASGVFFENEENRNAFVDWKLCDFHRTHVFSGAGINLEEFQYCPKEETGKLILLYVGRLMEEKGINELCAVAERIKTELPQVEFQLAGDFEEAFQKTYETKYSQLSNVTYLGYQENIKACIASADGIILPSYHEGMANALLEGGAIGRPLLTSNISGCREAAINGQTGFLFEPRSVDSLQEAVVKFAKLSSEERNLYGKKSREHIESKFDRKEIVARIMEITALRMVRSEE